MNYRRLGETGFSISEISLGTWQVGGKWGSPFDDANADQILDAAIEAGVNFIDTADVYEAGLSEQAVGRALKRHNDQRIYVATKCGRQLQPHVSESYQPKVLRQFVEDSLKRLDIECLDLIQLHCPPTEVYYRPEIFGLFDRLKEEGKILHMGVSVEKVEEALKAIEFPNVTTVQIIFNLFRHRPAALFFKEAIRRNIGVLARVPLASGMLTGKFGQNSTFAAGDHRQFNRNGEAFDKGETFSGVDYETGLQAVAALQQILPADLSLVHAALKWVLMHEAVSCVIPGASRPEQVVSNLQALDLPDLTSEQLAGIREVYDTYIKDPVHWLW